MRTHFPWRMSSFQEPLYLKWPVWWNVPAPARPPSAGIRIERVAGRRQQEVISRPDGNLLLQIGIQVFWMSGNAPLLSLSLRRACGVACPQCVPCRFPSFHLPLYSAEPSFVQNRPCAAVNDEKNTSVNAVVTYHAAIHVLCRRRGAAAAVPARVRTSTLSPWLYCPSKYDPSAYWYLPCGGAQHRRM